MQNVESASESIFNRDNLPGILTSNHYNPRGYAALFGTQQISIFGSSVVQFAVIWWLSKTYDSNLILSIATMVGLLSTVIISPFAGVLCDRWDRKKILIITDMIQATATFALIVLFWTAAVQLYHIYALLAIRGFMQGMQIPASISVMSSMVPPEKIAKFNSLNSILQALLQIGSPALGAVLVTGFSIQDIYWLDVITFIPAAMVLFRLKIPPLPDHEARSKIKINFLAELKDSLRFLKKINMNLVIIYFAIGNIMINPGLFMLPKLISVHFNETAFVYGAILVAVHVGYVAASAMIMGMQKGIPKVRNIIISTFMLTGSLFAFYFTPVGMNWMLYGIGVILGFFVAMVDVQIISLTQMIIPKEMQGRVFSTVFVLIKSLLPVFLIFWGWIADLSSVHTIYLICGIGSVIGTAVMLIFTPIMKLDFTKYAPNDNNGNQSHEYSVLEEKFILSDIADVNQPTVVSQSP